jgi:hypothetical protein
MSQSAVEIIRRRGAPRKQLPSREMLLELFDYDKENGELIWKPRPRSDFLRHRSFLTWNRRFAGKRAGSYICRPSGERRYVQIGLDYQRTGKNFLFNAHALICVIEEIAIPEFHEIDHKDGDPWNNRLSNLRVCTPRQNQRNSIGTRNKKSRLPKGVFKDRTRFVAKITVDRKTIRLGSFGRPEEAFAAYEKAAKELHGEFSILHRMSVF